MLTNDDKASIRIKLEEVYDIADKHLSQSKEDMIINDIEHYSYSYVKGKLEQIRQNIISGAVFNTPYIYRQLGVKVDNKLSKPAGCNKCDDGYIQCIQPHFGRMVEVLFACRCELGEFRHKLEKMAFWSNQEKSEFQKIRNGELMVEIDIDKVKAEVAKYGL